MAFTQAQEAAVADALARVGEGAETEVLMRATLIGFALGELGIPPDAETVKALRLAADAVEAGMAARDKAGATSADAGVTIGG